MAGALIVTAEIGERDFAWLNNCAALIIPWNATGCPRT